MNHWYTFDIAVSVVVFHILLLHSRGTKLQWIGTGLSASSSRYPLMEGRIAATPIGHRHQNRHEAEALISLANSTVGQCRRQIAPTSA